MRLRIIVGVIAILILLAGILYAVGKAMREPQAAPAGPAAFDVPTASASQAQAPVQVPAGYVPFSASAYGFSLYYPKELTEKVYDEGGKATTYTFQNISPAEGFQIFVTPYSGDQISADRFAMDEPSGVRENVRAARVGGAAGAAFYGRDVSLGDTYEVWFIRDGYLYEVTTLKPLENWLNAILATWRFN